MGRWRHDHGKRFVLALWMLSMVAGCRAADARAGTVRLDPDGERTQVRRPAGLTRAVKVRITGTERPVVKVRYRKDRKDRRIVFTAGKKGTADVTVSCHPAGDRAERYHYKAKAGPAKRQTAKGRAKKAFRIQNRYRQEKKAGKLEWSDELYAFCLYRIRISGFDRHKNLGRDLSDYFGDFGRYRKLFLTENLYSGSSRPERAMRGWKGSPGHYANLMVPEHACGAIACVGGIWCAVFYDGERAELAGWEQRKIVKVMVRRYDSGCGQCCSGCAFAYHEAGDTGTLEAAWITEAAGRAVYLEAGKEYVFYERKAPDGCGRAEPVTFLVTGSGERKIVLKDRGSRPTG